MTVLTNHIAGGLTEGGSVDQENVENYSKTTTSGYSSGVGNHDQVPIANISCSSSGTGYSSVRSQSGVSYNRYTNNMSANQNTDNYQVRKILMVSTTGLLMEIF